LESNAFRYERWHIIIVSYRKGKGTHPAIKRFEKFLRQVSFNHKMGCARAENSDHNEIIGYILKADIRHYFDSIDHLILLEKVREKIKDEKVMWLMFSLFDMFS